MSDLSEVFQRMSSPRRAGMLRARRSGHTKRVQRGERRYAEVRAENKQRARKGRMDAVRKSKARHYKRRTAHHANESYVMKAPDYREAVDPAKRCTNCIWYRPLHEGGYRCERYRFAPDRGWVCAAWYPHEEKAADAYAYYAEKEDPVAVAQNAEQQFAMRMSADSPEGVEEGALDEARTNLPIDHKAYTTKVKVRGWNVKVAVRGSADVPTRAKILASQLPDWTKADHARAAAAHQKAAEAQEKKWSALVNAAAQETWGRPYQMTDYRVSGIASSEFSSVKKDALRTAAHAKTAHKDIASAHEYAASRLRRVSEGVDEAPIIPELVRARAKKAAEATGETVYVMRAVDGFHLATKAGATYSEGVRRRNIPSVTDVQRTFSARRVMQFVPEDLEEASSYRASGDTTTSVLWRASVGSGADMRRIRNAADTYGAEIKGRVVELRGSESVKNALAAGTGLRFKQVRVSEDLEEAQSVEIAPGLQWVEEPFKGGKAVTVRLGSGENLYSSYSSMKGVKLGRPLGDVALRSLKSAVTRAVKGVDWTRGSEELRADARVRAVHKRVQSLFGDALVAAADEAELDERSPYSMHKSKEELAGMPWLQVGKLKIYVEQVKRHENYRRKYTEVMGYGARGGWKIVQIYDDGQYRIASMSGSGNDKFGPNAEIKNLKAVLSGSRLKESIDEMTNDPLVHEIVHYAEQWGRSRSVEDYRRRFRLPQEAAQAIYDMIPAGGIEQESFHAGVRGVLAGTVLESVSPEDRRRLEGKVIVSRSKASRLRKVGVGAPGWTIEYIDPDGAPGGSAVQLSVRRGAAKQAREIAAKLGLEVISESEDDDWPNLPAGDADLECVEEPQIIRLLRECVDNQEVVPELIERLTEQAEGRLETVVDVGDGRYYTEQGDFWALDDEGLLAEGTEWKDATPRADLFESDDPEEVAERLLLVSEDVEQASDRLETYLELRAGDLTESRCAVLMEALGDLDNYERIGEMLDQAGRLEEVYAPPMVKAKEVDRIIVLALSGARGKWVPIRELYEEPGLGEVKYGKIDAAVQRLERQGRIEVSARRVRLVDGTAALGEAVMHYSQKEGGRACCGNRRAHTTTSNKGSVECVKCNAVLKRWADKAAKKEDPKEGVDEALALKTNTKVTARTRDGEMEYPAQRIERATVYMSGEMFGNWNKHEVRWIELYYAPYAQYPNALHIRWVGKGKRKVRGRVLTYKPRIVVIPGWKVDLEPEGMFTDYRTDAKTGVSVAHSRRTSFDPGWDQNMRTRVAAYVKAGGKKPAVALFEEEEVDEAGEKTRVFPGAFHPSGRYWSVDFTFSDANAKKVMKRLDSEPDAMLKVTSRLPNAATAKVSGRTVADAVSFAKVVVRSVTPVEEEAVPLMGGKDPADDDKALAAALNKGIKGVAFVHAQAVTIIGRSSVTLDIALNPRETWTNGIFYNSQYARLDLKGGTMQVLTQSRRAFPKTFRKQKYKNHAEAVRKVNKFITTALSSASS